MVDSLFIPLCMHETVAALYAYKPGQAGFVQVVAFQKTDGVDRLLAKQAATRL